MFNCLIVQRLADLLEYLIQFSPFLGACHKPALDITTAFLNEFIPRGTVIQKLPGVVEGEGILHQPIYRNFQGFNIAIQCVNTSRCHILLFCS